MKARETAIDLFCLLCIYGLMSLYVVNDLPRTGPYLSGFLALLTVHTVRLERQIRALKSKTAAAQATDAV